MVTSEVVDKDPKFPCLMKGNITGIIVLFVEDRKGTVVHIPNPNHSFAFGEYYEEWSMGHFEPFHGVVKLCGH